MKKRLVGPLLAIALMGLAPTAAAAAEVNMGSSATTQTACDAGRGGPRAILPSLVAAAVDVGGVVVCDVDVLKNSVNNLLRNADIHVIENILNNSPILNDLNISDITVEVLGGVTTISVLGAPVLVLQ